MRILRQAAAAVALALPLIASPAPATSAASTPPAAPAALSNERAIELRTPAIPAIPATSAAAATPNPPASPAAPADRDTASLARLNTPAPDTTTATASEGDTAAAHPSRDDEPLGTPASETRPLGPGDDVPAGSATDGSWMLNTLGSLAVVIGLILAIRWAWQKVGGQPAAAGHSPVVEVLSRTAVAPRNHILLVRVGPRILVVGDSAAGLRTLANVDEPDEVADLLQAVTAAHHGRSFSRTLDRFSAEHDAHAYDPELGGDNSEHLVDRARDSLSSLLSRLRTAAGKGGTNP